MDSIIFISKYETYLNEIKEVVKPDYLSVIDELQQIDPHDLVSPESWFSDAYCARGLVWSLFLLKVREKRQTINGSK